MIKIILWDVDNTLLNFPEAEKAAIRACFQKLQLGTCSDEMLAAYSEINRKYWLRLEKGELCKQEVLIGRFQEFFSLYGLPVEKAAAFNEEYQVRLGDTCIPMDRSLELMQKLKEMGFRQYMITNGTIVAQKKKLALSGIDQIMDGAFISDEIGFEKPAAAFFDTVFKTLPEVSRAECLVVGDSLTSDIKGANNAGIKSCWYNPDNLPNRTDSVPDFVIDHLWNLLDIVKN